MRNLKVKCFLGVLFLNTSAVYAEVVRTLDWSYETTSGSFVSGYSSNSIQNGILIGNMRFHQSFLIDEKKSFEQNMSELVVHAKAQHQSLLREKDRILSSFSSTLRPSCVPEEIPMIVSESTSQAHEAIAPQLKFDWLRFSDCAHKTLPELMMILEAEEQLQSRTLPIEEEVTWVGISQTKQQELAKVRSLSSNSPALGVVCGKFLGPAGFTSRGLVEDVKFLTAITSREEKEAKQILATAIAAFHEKASPEIIQVWGLYWKMISFEAVFSKKELSSVEALLKQLQAGLIQEFSGDDKKFTLDVGDIQKATEVGYQFAESLMGP